MRGLLCDVCGEQPADPTTLASCAACSLNLCACCRLTWGEERVCFTCADKMPPPPMEDEIPW
jgi:hypothetical protein